MTTTKPDTPKKTRHRIHEIPGQTTPPPGQPADREKEQKAKKVDQMVAMMRRPEGASLNELIDLTGWKDHSVRAFISRNLKKGKGLPVERKKIDGGQNLYTLPPLEETPAQAQAEHVEEAI